MEKRICPKCNIDWYSADSFHDWTCKNCGTIIPKLNKKENKNDSNSTFNGSVCPTHIRDCK